MKDVRVERRAFLGRPGTMFAASVVQEVEYYGSDKPYKYDGVTISTGYDAISLSLKEFDKLTALVAKNRAAFEEKVNETK